MGGKFVASHPYLITAARDAHVWIDELIES
jgi:hypothetical protein